MLRFIIGMMVGIAFAFWLDDRQPDTDKDPNHGTNYVWKNLVEVPEDRSGADTWFQQEYDALEWSWQKMVRKYDHMPLPEDMAADVITFNYLPWAQELRDETAKRDVPHKKRKLEILDLRIKSLEALEGYYREYQEEDFDEYIEYDSQFRDIVQSHPEVFQ